MKLTVISVNHRTAPVELRERLAVDEQRFAQAVARLRRSFPVAELTVVSTCNRVEWYVARPLDQPPDLDELRHLIGELCNVPVDELTAATITRENRDAVEHLFRVVSGLESMVLGEPQILGQVRRAYEQAAAHNVVGPVLHTLFQTALATGKQVRTETGIDEGRVSIGSAAVDFARQIFDSFADKVVVGIGAGEMAKLTLQHLLALEPKKLWLTNRTTERARDLAQRLNITGERGEASGGVRHFDDLDQLLVEADIVLTSTAAPEPFITAERFKPLEKRRRGRPLFILDIAVPRDVSPDVTGVSNVYLYDIDDLQHVVEETHEKRSHHAQRAQVMVRQAAEGCMLQIQNHDIGRMVRALRTRLHDIGKVEQDRTLARMRTADPEQFEHLLHEHTQRLINKVLHLPLRQLDRRQPASALGFFAAALTKLFDLGNSKAHIEPEESAEAELQPSNQSQEP